MNCVHVLIAESSLRIRELLINVLQTSTLIQVVGVANTGTETIQLNRQLKPDVIVMNANMSETDGIDATHQIMAEVPCPVVIVTNSLHEAGSHLLHQRVQAGQHPGTRTIRPSQESCIMFGVPSVTIDMETVEQVVSALDIAIDLLNLPTYYNNMAYATS